MKDSSQHHAPSASGWEPELKHFIFSAVVCIPLLGMYTWLFCQTERGIGQMFAVIAGLNFALLAIGASRRDFLKAHGPEDCIPQKFLVGVIALNLGFMLWPIIKLL